MTATQSEAFLVSGRHLRNVRTVTVLLILAGFVAAWLLQSG
jgi:hypothetical protein